MLDLRKGGKMPGEQFRAGNPRDFQPATPWSRKSNNAMLLSRLGRFCVALLLVRWGRVRARFVLSQTQPHLPHPFRRARRLPDAQALGMDCPHAHAAAAQLLSNVVVRDGLADKLGGCGHWRGC